jgi:hypothetical protein
VIAAVVTVGVLVTAAPAHAGWKMDRAEEIADTVWRHPCNGNVPVSWDDPARVFAAVDPYRPPMAWTRPGDCTLHLNGPWIARWGIPWSDLCPSVLHEYGHLAGMQHSPNPRSVMYPVLHPDSRCRSRGRPYLEAHGALLRPGPHD